MKPQLLKGGRVVDPSQDHDDVVDLLIVDGKIEAMGNGLGEPDGAELVDLNVQLGFRPTKAWLQFRKELGATADE